ncbi:hypothetical protein P154DRAFT_62935 [Amniculicola lignicola CBS 123094]|uniref:WAP domain-containing protein n=1 Tax=Amniculicola lignicola CBS 123094 TaxID=1392246 RepID=A0A6A5VY99_9PLEO|nr:hypothetical protein P154DRAFT_62935 [Amniculicola lignicola CBS 123094]
MFSPRIQLVLLSVTFLIASYISGMTHHNHQVHNQIRRLQKEDVSRNPAATPRQSPHVARDYHQLHSGLFKRDTCGAVFPGRYTDSCGSEATTCCIIPGMQRPACVEILGKGACCTEHIDCFVDTKSDCDDTESEQCAVDVCCPKNTHCVDGVKYNNPDDIRCNFDRAFIPGYVITSKMSEKPVARNTASPDRSTSTKKHKRTGTDFSDLPTSTESHRHTIKKSADSSTTTKRHKHTTTTSSDPQVKARPRLAPD